MNNFRKICEKSAISTGHWTTARLSFNKDFLNDSDELRAHAELLNNDFPPLTQGRPEGLKSITQLCSTCPSLPNENSQTSVGILTLDEVSGETKMKREHIMSRKELLKDIKTLAKANEKYLNYSYIKSIKRHDLFVAAIKYFGGWRGAVKAAGYRPILKDWTKREILACIHELKEKFKVMPPYKQIWKLGYQGLTSAARRQFGSWNSAVIEAGYVPIKREWTKVAVIKGLKEVANKLKHTPSMRELMQLKKHDLLNAAITKFGKYNDALRRAGLPIVLEMNKWSKRKVISELKNISKQLGKKPTRSEVRDLGRYDLNMATLSVFGSWNKAMRAAGFTPNYDAIHNDLGQRWESIVANIATEIYPDAGVHFKLPNRGLPDLYVFDEKLVIEAKINISENNVKSDTEKYLPYCRRLQIWYLYGIPPSTLSDKIEVIGIDRIIPFVNADQELKKQFRNLVKDIGGKNVNKELPKKVLVLGSGAL